MTHITREQRNINGIIGLMNHPEKIKEIIDEKKTGSAGWQPITAEDYHLLQPGDKIRYSIGHNWDERILSNLNIQQGCIASPGHFAYLPLGKCQVYRN